MSLWDVAAAAGFAVGWADGGIDNRDRTREGHPWEPEIGQSYQGDMQKWYTMRPGKVIGDRQWPTAAQADNLFQERTNPDLLEPLLSVPSACEIDGPQTSFPSSLYYPAHAPACTGNTALFEHEAKYIDSFLKLNGGSRRAGFMSFLEPHNTQRSFPDQDKFLADMLRRYTATEGDDDAKMGNSAIFVWGDHGFHYTMEAMTTSGRSARKQPAGWLMLPKTWALEHPDMYSALVGNAASLVSHFDMHMTLRHLLTGRGGAPPPAKEKLGGEEGETHAFTLMKAEKGAAVQSLFAPFENPERSCADAGVGPDFCPCHVTVCSGDLASDEAVLGRLDLIAKKVNGRAAAANVTDVCKPLVAHATNATTFVQGSIGKKDPSCEKQELDDGKVSLTLFLEQTAWKTHWRVTVTATDKPGVIEDIGIVTAESQWGPMWETCLPFMLTKFGVKELADLIQEHPGAWGMRQTCFCEHLLA